MAMFEIGTGDMLHAKVDAIVNPVNTEGVMGKGLALQVKRAFPDVFQAYALGCRRGEIVIGKVHVVVERRDPWFFVINFPTKQSWRQPSRLEYIDAGLVDLVKHVRGHDIQSIAIPPLGCGLGGLDWAVVKPRIVEAMSALPDVRVVLFVPL